MGSTVIAGVMHDETLHVCHVGDVRAYHLSRGHLRRVTNDHSWVWETFVMSGLLTPEQARTHPQRRVVTQAIGRLQGVSPDTARIPLRAGDRVLLCSDGLWGALSDKELGAVVGSNGSMQELASMLVDKANDAGGEDNITAILYEHGESPDRA
jgi:protein phosphatase